MAVADFGVAIGPRSKRRLAIGAIVVAATVLITAAGLLLLRPLNAPGPVSSAGSVHPATPRLVTDEVVYGMSKPEVRRRVGEPTKTVGACWQYNENKLIRGGQNMLNAQRLCFLGGVYSYDYSRIDGKWFYPTTPLTIGSSS